MEIKVKEILESGFVNDKTWIMVKKRTTFGDLPICSGNWFEDKILNCMDEQVISFEFNNQLDSLTINI